METSIKRHIPPVYSAQVETGQDGSGQVKLGQFRTGQVWSIQVRSCQVRSSQVRSGQVKPGRMQGPMQDRILNGMRQRVTATTDDALRPVARDRWPVACGL